MKLLYPLAIVAALLANTVFAQTLPRVKKCLTVWTQDSYVEKDSGGTITTGDPAVYYLGMKNACPQTIRLYLVSTYDDYMETYSWIIATGYDSNRRNSMAGVYRDARYLRASRKKWVMCAEYYPLKVHLVAGYPGCNVGDDLALYRKCPPLPEKHALPGSNVVVGKGTCAIDGTRIW